MFSYLEKFGDKALDELPFTEVDNVILSEFSYCGFDKCVDMLPCPLSELNGKLSYGVNAKNRELAKRLCESRRFGGSVVVSYHNEFSEQETKQFCAVTFLLSDGTAYVAYRGTDSTLVGWKEDFMLCFDTMVPAQKLAVDYLDSMGRLLSCPLRVGGHSKGGNLAVYASAFCSQEVRDLITEVYSNDGPGFVQDIMESEGYRSIRHLIHKFIPESSVIGRLLENDVEPQIIESSAFGLWQHDPYSWKTDGAAFAKKPCTDALSEVMRGTFAEWMKGMDSDKRRYMTDVLFGLAGAGDDKTLGELVRNPMSIPSAVAAFSKLDPEDRKHTLEIAEALIKAAKSSSGKVLKQKLDETRDGALKKVNRDGSDDN